jgi:COP9 signalosome complex subunit 4
VLGAFVAALTASLGLQGEEDEAKWAALGDVFKGREEDRKAVIEGVLGDNAGWCEEQTTRLRRAQSSILQNEEDWAGAADALIRIPLEGGSR